MNLWIKDTNGKSSSSLTFATCGFIIVAVWLVLSIFAKIGKIDIRPFSGGEAMAFLVPLLTLYFGRRWSDKKDDSGGGTMPSLPPPTDIGGKS